MDFITNIALQALGIIKITLLQNFNMKTAKIEKYLNNLKLFLICVWIKVLHFLMSQSSSLNANLNG